MRVWIDQDGCTGVDLGTEYCPELFVLLEDGISYVDDGEHIASDPGAVLSTVAVPARHETAGLDAALDCPGECIFIEHGKPPREPQPRSGRH